MAVDLARGLYESPASLVKLYNSSQMNNMLSTFNNNDYSYFHFLSRGERCEGQLLRWKLKKGIMILKGIRLEMTTTLLRGLLARMFI